MALLKNSMYKDAYDVANDNLLSTEFKSLLAQAVLFYESQSRESNSIVTYIKNRNDPVFFEYLATLLDNDDLLINSALLWANSGEIEKAFNLISSINRNSISQIQALLAYDSGRESEALVRLLELPESDSIRYDNILLIADLFYIKENWARSKFYYEKAIDIDVTNPLPYINISSIYRKISKLRQAIITLDTGIDTISSESVKLSDDIEDLIDKSSGENTNIELALSQRLLNKKREKLINLQNGYRDLVLL
ncbi:MAG: hypothetical protein B6229_08335 [Spirochaetaceae bacterium 4572_7]|nr:MAG: hypothetical protein B6229_08335 [Spirochaetaceae bacterium 4572_7]